MCWIVCRPMNCAINIYSYVRMQVTKFGTFVVKLFVLN